MPPIRTWPALLLLLALAACAQQPTAPAAEPETPGPAAALPACLRPRVVALDQPYIVFFDAHKADLTARSRQILDELARASRRTSTMLVGLHGNTDASETRPADRNLGRRRAEAAARYLEGQGISRDRIWVEDHSNGRPLVPKPPGVPEPVNRRVGVALAGYGMARALRQECTGWVRQNCIGKAPDQVHPSCDAALARLEDEFP